MAVAGVPVIFVAFTICVIGGVVLTFGIGVDVGMAVFDAAVFDVVFDTVFVTVAGLPVIFVALTLLVIGVAVLTFGMGVDVDLDADVGIAVDVDFGIAGFKKMPACLASLTSLSDQFFSMPDREPYGIVSLQSFAFGLFIYLIYSCFLTLFKYLKFIQILSSPLQLS